MKKSILLSLIVLFALPLGANNDYTKQDSLVYEKCISELLNNKNFSVSDLNVSAGLYFLGTPYMAHTLDKSLNEKLVINLREFDCTTFVESCMALARTMKSGNYSFQNYCRELQNIRYRKGVIEDYSSRLHYVSDWIYDNSQKGIMRDISRNLGGITLEKKITFMSSHPNAYIQLKQNPAMQEKIKRIESDINKRGGYTVIKKENIPAIENQIGHGDIIAFATSIEGLDYSHIGIAYRAKDRVTFIHASTRSRTVVIESGSLYDYCMKSSKCTGITVLSLNEINK